MKRSSCATCHRPSRRASCSFTLADQPSPSHPYLIMPKISIGTTKIVLRIILLTGQQQFSKAKKNTKVRQRRRQGKSSCTFHIETNLQNSLYVCCNSRTISRDELGSYRQKIQFAFSCTWVILRISSVCMCAKLQMREKMWKFLSYFSRCKSSFCRLKIFSVGPKFLGHLICPENERASFLSV